MRAQLAAVAVGTLLVVAACGDDGAGDSTPAADAGTPVPVTVGVLPILPTAAIELGIEKGIFAEHGLDITLESGQGGAALLPAVVSGQIDFATSNPLSVMIAQQKGLDVEVVTGYSHSKASGDDVTGVYALPASGIAGPADLAGRTVAVNTLNGQGDLTIRQAVRAAGGDPDAVEFVELGFPDMPAALEAGNVDAAWVPEPFQSILRAQGAELVMYNYQSTAPGLPTMVMIAGGRLAEENPELIDRFAAATDEVTAYAQEHPDEMRAMFPDRFDLSDELTTEVVIEDFAGEIDPAPLESLAEWAHADGLIEDEVDVAEFVPAD